jgi:hypothetical protein
VAVHDTGILDRLAQRLVGWRLAERRRAQVGQRFVAMDRYLAAEEGEEVAGMILEDR